MPGNPHQATTGRESNLELIINGVYLTHDHTYWTSSRLRHDHFSHIIYVDRRTAALRGTPQILDPAEFECLELNFKSSLVLPNLYKSDKFMAKALENDGKILIMEPLGGPHYQQKAFAIILGYLMSHYDLRFRDAYEALRKVYRSKFELDRFLIMQLYEYEPILQVHRATEEMPHSRSGERLRSLLKRSSCMLDSSFEDDTATATNVNCHRDGEEEGTERVLNDHIDDTRRLAAPPPTADGMDVMIE